MALPATQTVNDFPSAPIASTRASTFHLQQFAVSFEFPVVFTEGLFRLDNTVLVDTVNRLENDKRHRLMVFVDDGILSALPTLCEWIQEYCAEYEDSLDLVVAPIAVPGGELIKNSPQSVNFLREHIDSVNLDRHSYVMAIGGGAVLDTVGFVAATAHRGIRHLRVPTTVLAQNDSGVGVKNGVNQFGQKNYMGTFAPPFAVLNDFEFLLTLNRREQRGGIAEAVKVALIRDQHFFEWIEDHTEDLFLFDHEAVRTMIERCAELHMHQIANGGDPFENGSARPLDFGHWSAHKLETLSQHELTHGEAVAIGIALDTHYSVSAGLLPLEAALRVKSVLKSLGFSLWHNSLEKQSADGTSAVIAGLHDFQSHLGGQLTITLLSAIGTGIEVHQMNEQFISDAISWLRQEHATCD